MTDLVSRQLALEMQIADHFHQTGFYAGERTDSAPARFIPPDTLMHMQQQHE